MLSNPLPSLKPSWLTYLNPKVYIDAQWDPEEGNLGTLPIAMQVSFLLTSFRRWNQLQCWFLFCHWFRSWWNIYIFPNQLNNIPTIYHGHERFNWWLIQETIRMYEAEGAFLSPEYQAMLKTYAILPYMYKPKKTWYIKHLLPLLRPLQKSWLLNSQCEHSQLRIVPSPILSITGSMWSCRLVSFGKCS